MFRRGGGKKIGREKKREGVAKKDLREKRAINGLKREQRRY